MDVLLKETRSFVECNNMSAERYGVRKDIEPACFLVVNIQVSVIQQLNKDYIQQLHVVEVSPLSCRHYSDYLMKIIAMYDKIVELRKVIFLKLL